MLSRKRLYTIEQLDSIINGNTEISSELEAMLDYMLSYLREDATTIEHGSALKTFKDDFELSMVMGLNAETSFMLPE
jgi:hypothetical protein